MSSSSTEAVTIASPWVAVPFIPACGWSPAVRPCSGSRCWSPAGGSDLFETHRRRVHCQSPFYGRSRIRGGGKTSYRGKLFDLCPVERKRELEAQTPMQAHQSNVRNSLLTKWSQRWPP